MLTKCLRISLDSVSGAKVSPTLQRNDPEEICQTPSHPFGKRAQVSESTPSLKPFPMARCSLSRQIHEYRLDCFHRAIPYHLRHMPLLHAIEQDGCVACADPLQGPSKTVCEVHGRVAILGVARIAGRQQDPPAHV